MEWIKYILIFNSVIIASCIVYGAYINIKSFLFQREIRLFQEELRDYLKRYC